MTLKNWWLEMTTLKNWWLGMMTGNDSEELVTEELVTEELVTEWCVRMATLKNWCLGWWLWRIGDWEELVTEEFATGMMTRRIGDWRTGDWEWRLWRICDWGLVPLWYWCLRNWFLGLITGNVTEELDYEWRLWRVGDCEWRRLNNWWLWTAMVMICNWCKSLSPSFVVILTLIHSYTHSMTVMNSDHQYRSFPSSLRRVGVVKDPHELDQQYLLWVHR